MSLGTTLPGAIRDLSRPDSVVPFRARKHNSSKIKISGLGAVLLACLQGAPCQGLELAAPGGKGFAVAGGERALTAQQDNPARITVTGARITQGNAVDCPQVRTDDGQVYSISYLAPSIAIGDRVSVTGYMAYSTTCLGPVLKAEKVVHQQ